MSKTFYVLSDTPRGSVPKIYIFRYFCMLRGTKLAVYIAFLIFSYQPLVLKAFLKKGSILLKDPFCILHIYIRGPPGNKLSSFKVPFFRAYLHTQNLIIGKKRFDVKMDITVGGRFKFAQGRVPPFPLNIFEHIVILLFTQPRIGMQLEYVNGSHALSH